MDVFDILNGFFVYLIIWGTMSYLIGYATKTPMWWTFFFGLLGTIIGVILKYDHEEEMKYYKLLEEEDEEEE